MSAESSGSISPGRAREKSFDTEWPPKEYRWVTRTRILGLMTTNHPTPPNESLALGRQAREPPLSLLRFGAVTDRRIGR